jgi:hypothetical protein
MSHVPSLPVTPSGSPELVAAEADYEALTDALMQTRRGRWFLAEHARRCREADHVDLCATLARIEEALAEPREPAGLAEIQEQLSALPRIEQALADYRDPPALAELRESLGALARIEVALAEPREPAGLAEIQEKLGALPRIEQAVAEPREVPGIAELHERVVAFAETLDGIRAEVAAQQPTEREEAERAQAREREEEMLRLLREQRARLDAFADIWAPLQTAPEPVASEPPAVTTRVAAAVSLAADGDSAPTPPAEMAGNAEPAGANEQTGEVEPAPEPAAMLFDAQTPTTDLLNQTMIFGLRVEEAEAPPPIAEIVQVDTTESRAPVDWTFAPPAETQPKEPPSVADTDPAAQTSAEPLSPQADPAASAVVAEAPTDAAPPAPAASVDPIVQMFIDAEQPASDAEPPASPTDDDLSWSEPAVGSGALPLPEGAKLPTWLVGAATTEAQSADYAGLDAEQGDAEALSVPAQAGPALNAAVDEEAALDAALFEAEPMLETAADAETDTAATVRSDMPGLAELTLDLLQKALRLDPARAHEPAPAADPSALGDSFAGVMSEDDLRAAITALRRALGHEDDPAAEGESMSEMVILDDLPVRPPSLASLRAPEPSEPASADPLAPVYALSEEERIALFS